MWARMCFSSKKLSPSGNKKTENNYFSLLIFNTLQENRIIQFQNYEHLNTNIFGQLIFHKTSDGVNQYGRLEMKESGVSLMSKYAPPLAVPWPG